ncbi:hypothetical protein [Rhizobium rhizogenes]|uniref:hypothetical protein n=1 Tax=Rhizobium rhizogenes TaxID=359 RepID=UPI001572DC18|nr:hypothetical protein [Rhizobium rhizogenes]NTG64705.1 hypothetical protein [Rhizobium rhizogenes]NTH68428.1 hypothetical protein [Rhizobium rhizogenes]NTH99907.1 hypothetical protein [Rhizobium rhizogenes]NTI39057.1 hypothetical protein [Rhizobium rhizogenes]NTJ18199.1 hypothetical protein [Rhizobium rhizogenes]
MIRLNLIFPIILLSSCTSLPNSKQLADFGSAVDSGVSSLSAIAAENKTISLAAERELQAVNYITGADFKLLEEPESSINMKEIVFRQKKIKVLADYGSALKAAADDGNIQKLQDASSALAEAVANLGTAVAPGAGAILSPVAKAAGKGVGLALSDRYARRVNQIIRDTDPSVQIVVRSLKQDVAIISGSSEIALIEYKLNQKTALATIRGNSSANGSTTSPPVPTSFEVAGRAQLHEQFLESAASVDAANAAFAATAEYDNVLDQIAKTHHALAEQSGKAKFDVDTLVALTGNLSDLVQAAKKGK